MLYAAGPARAQTPPRDDAFSRGRWTASVSFQPALEAWNYNRSHEELYGLVEGVAYGLRDGLLVTASQRIYYVSQASNDSWVLGISGGLRARVCRRGRFSVYLDFEVGISDAAIAAPPRGTRFNYIALGSGGTAFRVTPRLQMTAGLQLVHLSNASLKGPGRNPDIEAIGPTLGLLIGF